MSTLVSVFNFGLGLGFCWFRLGLGLVWVRFGSVWVGLAWLGLGWVGFESSLQLGSIETSRAIGKGQSEQVDTQQERANKSAARIGANRTQVSGVDWSPIAADVGDARRANSKRKRLEPRLGSLRSPPTDVTLRTRDCARLETRRLGNAINKTRDWRV